MKKTVIFYFTLAAILAGSISSCREADLGFNEEEIAKAAFEKEYTENFEKDYGKIAPGHTWGFDEESRSVGTRAEGDNYVNYKVDRQEETVTSQEFGTERFYAKANKMPSPGPENIYDKRFAQMSLPAPITYTEQQAVFDFLNGEHKDDPAYYSTTIDLNSYFLQDVGRRDHEFQMFTDNTQSTPESSQKYQSSQFMSELYIGVNHLNDYNNSKVGSHNNDDIMSGLNVDYYVTNSNLNNPTYYDTNSSTRVENHYRFYYIPGWGLYLCFEYETHKDNGSEHKHFVGDGIYDDWVIKITPGASHRFRVFCEDLGSTLDLDFNDLVFDYYYNSYTSSISASPSDKITIKVLALEGTLPIWIADQQVKTDNVARHNVNMPEFMVSYSNIISVPITVQNAGTSYCFTAEDRIGKSPYLLRVDPTASWPAENVRIEKKYERFTDFVRDPEANHFWWWNKNTQFYPEWEQTHNGGNK